MSLPSLYSSLVGAQGHIPLHLYDWRLVASNDVPAIAVASGNGGNLGSDTAPKLIRVNTSTDKCLTISWASSGVIEIFQSFIYPPDMDVTQTYSVNLRAKSGTTDTPVVTVGLFEGIGDTTRGGNTGASGSVLATLSATITPTGGFPNFACVTLVPGSHTTDAFTLYAAWITYTKKLVSA